MKSARTRVTVGRLGFFLVALPLLLAVGPKECPGVIDVQCGDVLDIDHGWYKLSGDLLCPLNPSFAAVTITGERVHFNLAGHTITRDDNTGRFLERGIDVRAANAHINGGSIVDINCPAVFFDRFCSAIHLRAPGARINGMSLHNNETGIISFSEDNADGARIHGNDITGNLRWGIGLFGSAEGSVITGNDLSNTGGFVDPAGVTRGTGYVARSSDVSLIGNVANDCVRSGITLFRDENSQPAAQAQGNTVRNNTTLGNGRNGISSVGGTEAFRPSDNLIQSNTSFGNGIRDLVEAVVGEGPAADCLNTWKDNDFDVAAPDCIE